MATEGKTTVSATPVVPYTRHKEQTTFTSNTINALAIFRGLIGVGSMIAPVQLLKPFGFIVPPHLAILVRLAGSRDIVLAEKLWNANRDLPPNGGHSEVQKMLWAGIVVDAMDVGSVVLALSSGHLPRGPGAAFAVGGALFVGMGAIGLRGLA